MVGEDFDLTMRLDKLRKTTETDKKSKDESRRKTTWTYRFTDVEDDVTITVKTRTERGWVEDETYAFNVRQPHYQARLDRAPELAAERRGEDSFKAKVRGLARKELEKIAKRGRKT